MFRFDLELSERTERELDAVVREAEARRVRELTGRLQLCFDGHLVIAGDPRWNEPLVLGVRYYGALAAEAAGELATRVRARWVWAELFPAVHELEAFAAQLGPGRTPAPAVAEPALRVVGGRGG